MGLFSGQSRKDAVLDNPENTYTDVPELPKPRDNDTVIAKNIVVTGKITGEGVIQVEGSVIGEVDMKGLVTVTPTGSIKGPVQADVIHVAGRIEGNIIASDHLRLEKTGRVEGDITTVSFVVCDGGRLNGRATMTGDDPNPHVAAAGPDDSETATSDN